MRRRLMILLVACPVAAWGLLGLLGKPIAREGAARFGSRILRLGDGKFTSPETFIELRLRDCALLLTAACLLALARAAATSAFTRRLPSRVRWISDALVGFVCVNVFAVLAAQTVLFWCLLFTGKGRMHNYTQFQIKRGLMKAVQAPHQAVLLGSSQTRAEIDERLLNDRLGRDVWTTELHFPGNHAYELVLNLEALPAVQVDYILCYLSEGYFYSSAAESDGLLFFFGFRDLGEFYKLGGRHVRTGRSLAYALLGNALPLFRLRDPLAGRILGSSIQSLKQEQYDQSLSTNLAQRAKAIASGYQAGPESDFQKNAFSAFAHRCREQHRTLVVCCGQFNPILGKALDPALRSDMLAFLRNQAGHDANIVLLDEPDLPKQTEADYDDLTHVNEAAQIRFTEFIAGVMQKLLRKDHAGQ
jgi:hypothetical protein